MKCSACEGTGKQTITFTETKIDEKTGRLIAKKAPSYQTDCIWCKGTGVLTKRMKGALTYYKTIWCECLENHGSVFL